MALVTFRGSRPEVSLGWPDGCALRPWPHRGTSTRNLSLTFPRQWPVETPPLAALWLAAVRRREGPWFTVRFHRGEFQRLQIELAPAGWGTTRCYPPPHRMSRRRLRAWYRRHPARHVLKARDVLGYLSPKHAEQFVAGCYKRFEVWDGEKAIITSDPLFG